LTSQNVYDTRLERSTHQGWQALGPEGMAGMGRDRLARYGLTSPENDAAVELGLAGGAWFRSAIPRKRMKELMRRSDYPAVRDTAIWFGLIFALAGLGIAFWGTWWAVPFFAAYGVLYGSTSDSRWHESGHGTAFKTRWMDQGLYQIASFMIMRDPTTWRWSHTRHHTDTLIVGRDPEIAVMRPARLVRLLANLVGLVDVPLAFRLMFRHAFGRLTADEADYVPESERHKVYRTARIDLAIYATAIGLAIGLRTWLPVVLIGGPRLYGAFLFNLYGFTQHAGMGENVLDHELPRRASHVPDGAVLPAAGAARGGQARLRSGVPVDVGGLQGDRPCGAAPVAGPGVLHPPRAAARCRAVQRASAAGRRPGAAAGRRGCGLNC
jgi:fatty acid desaturase